MISRMSDDKVSLEFLGEQMVRMQTDLREVRREQAKLEGELRADVADVRGDVAGLRADVADVRADVARVDSKLDGLAASVDARFDQVQRTMTANLDVVLKALEK